jgi:hypothetical protein
MAQLTIEISDEHYARLVDRAGLLNVTPQELGRKLLEKALHPERFTALIDQAGSFFFAECPELGISATGHSPFNARVNLAKEVLLARPELGPLDAGDFAEEDR